MRTTSTDPFVRTHTTVASGTASASRPTPDRARSGRPSERVPSGKMPMQEPLRSSSMAVFIASWLLVPRSIGMCPISVISAPTTLFFHSDDFASARICRTPRAATAIAIGSQ
jgi:hypothetical protein